MAEFHPDHEAVRNVIASEPKLADPVHPELKKLPPPHLHWLWRIGIGVVGLIVVLFLTFAIGYMRFSWQKSWLLIPAKLVPFPVAIIGGHWISYYDYQSDVPNIESFLQRNETPDAAASRKIDENTYTRKVILNKDVGEAILDTIAAQQKVTVSSQDIQTTYDQYVQQSGNATDVAQYIRTLYNWSVDQFKLKLIRPQVVQDKLAQQFYNQAKQALTTIRDQVAATPSTFADVAKKESQDSATAGKGGAVDAMTTAQLETAYSTSTATGSTTSTTDTTPAKTIEAMKVGDISPVLSTSLGYEVVMLVKKGAAPKKADGTMYTISRIVKQPDFNTWLSDKVNTQATKDHVFLFEPRFRWEAACGILAKSEPSCSASTTTNTNTSASTNVNS